MTSLVFLHGFLGSPAEWQPTIDALAVDMPKAALTLPLAENWNSGLRKVIEQLPARSVLVGYSLGARVALGTALAVPLRLRGLCLVSVNPGLEPTERQARRDRDAELVRRVVSDPWPEFLDNWYRQDVFSSLDSTTRATWIKERLSLDRPYQAKLLSCYSIAGQPDYWPQLCNVSVPTAIVAGELDHKYVAIARQMQRQAPQCNLRVVSFAGHAVHREQPAALHRILNDFVSSLTSESTSDE
jgi:2-succinyl-6-hydroxy-2,4-cyclohexadiene-1-carboxylate synthase